MLNSCIGTISHLTTAQRQCGALAALNQTALAATNTTNNCLSKAASLCQVGACWVGGGVHQVPFTVRHLD